ncbi:30S ribosomal protein S3 [uncultured archaeon]|nr:30S ribosomal protein S3 [uncultured archaeon]
MAMEKHFIQEGVIRSQVEKYLHDELNRAGYSGINIQKTHLATRVILYVEKPPIVIGKKGKRINKLTRALKEDYGIENPVIDVQRIERPTLDPNIVARRIAVALERGMNRRRIVYKALRAIMMSGARGVEIQIGGKLAGKGGRSRSEKYLEGYMKKAGDSSKLVKMGKTQAFVKSGVIGVSVRIVPPEITFPDQIRVIQPEAPQEPAAAAEAPVAETAADAVKTASEKPKTRKRAAPKKKEASEGEATAEPKKRAPRKKAVNAEKAPNAGEEPKEETPAEQASKEEA